jgi:5-methylcytosine-specific restriction endonuclease McrA
MLLLHRLLFCISLSALVACPPARVRQHHYHQGGRNTWDNLVACCMHCNQRKGGSLLRDLGWRLKTTPREPTSRDLGVVLGVSQVGLGAKP